MRRSIRAALVYFGLADEDPARRATREARPPVPLARRLAVQAIATVVMAVFLVLIGRELWEAVIIAALVNVAGFAAGLVSDRRT